MRVMRKSDDVAKEVIDQAAADKPTARGAGTNERGNFIRRLRRATQIESISAEICVICGQKPEVIGKKLTADEWLAEELKKQGQ